MLRARVCLVASVAVNNRCVEEERPRQLLALSGRHAAAIYTHLTTAPGSFTLSHRKHVQMSIHNLVLLLLRGTLS